ncbi:hypothetical protein Cni_G27687 [Canna indica]|uniref:FAD-binding domain-containing protein n=1 Tax=Canna indica TaxID=4628 RepID=A0AAQ3L262_9LILI|nr:hypothetical protein Cni_G27687 [Canna indica]
MELSNHEDIVIVGAGLGGLSVAVGLHRLGLRSLVLESSDILRSSGFALTIWTNAWRALDALGVGDSLRQQHVRLEGVISCSALSGSVTSKIAIKEPKKPGDREVRCLRRNLLVETLAKELPDGTIRCSSKVVAIEEAGKLKLLHLADGSTLKAKVLIGCDGINSIVSKWLGLKAPVFSGRCAARGFAMYPGGHGIKREFAQYFGKGFRAGVLPCDDEMVYWFFTWTSDGNDEETMEDAIKVREFVIGKMKNSNVPEEVIQVIEKSEPSSVASSHLRYRSPFHLLWGDVSKGNVCVTGDAFHPMTPDLGQGGCSALEDGVVLAKCLGEALCGGQLKEDEESRIEAALQKYARARRWRAFDLVATSIMLGFIQEGGNGFLALLRDQVLSGFMLNKYFSEAGFDFGKL